MYVRISGIIWRSILTQPTVMNLSHVIDEFSFGPYFPKIVQPLDNSAYVLAPLYSMIGNNQADTQVLAQRDYPSS